MELHERMKKAREAAHLTQQDLAEQVHMNRSTFSGYETGARQPSERTLADISRICGVSLEWLRSGEGDMVEAKKAATADPDSTVAYLASEYGLRPEIKELIRTICHMSPTAQNLTVEYLRNISACVNPTGGVNSKLATSEDGKKGGTKDDLGLVDV